LGENSYVILGGIEQGERVAVSSLQALRDGMQIVPKPAALALAPAATVQNPAAASPAQDGGPVDPATAGSAN
jgi:hypothetical protein